MKIHSLALLVLIVLLTVLSVVGRSSADLCGRARQLVNFTRVDIANGGFCSDSRPSCCHGWEGLVQPGIELLFEKTTFSQFSALATLLNDIKLFLKELHCTLDIEEGGTLRKDVTSALTELQEIDWTRLVNMTMSTGGCRLAVTRLMFCSSQYCLINNESNVFGEGRFCRSDCMTTVRHCVLEPFELINGDWKQAIGSVSTALRILAAKSQCPEQRPQFDNFVTKLNEWRDPVSRTSSSCASGHNECPLSQQRSEFHNVSGDKSILISLSNRLQSVTSNLGKYWSQVPDDIQSSGSGWGDNLPTDDEDLLSPFDDHDGSGEEGSGEHPHDFSHFSTTSSTTTTTIRPRVASHGSSSLYRANSQLLLLYITPLISLISMWFSNHVHSLVT